MSQVELREASEDEKETKKVSKHDDDSEESEEEDDPEFLAVLPYLYVGNYSAADDLATLKAAGITHIVNLASDLVDDYHPDSFVYLNVPCNTSIDYPIEDHFERVAKFILSSKDESPENKIFMHCTDNEDLSPSFMLAYMLIAAFEKHKKLPLKDALNHVSKKFTDAGLREVYPNDGFMSKLIQLEKKLFGAVSMKLASRPRKNVKSTAGKGSKVRGRKRGNKRGQAW